MTWDSEADLTADKFLGGRLLISQPKHGYRAATDPILMAASVATTSGQSVLELGCGVGTALFALGVRVPGLELHGVERQSDYAALAVQNAKRAALTAEIWDCDLAHLPDDLRQRQFDHVMMNPPYFCQGEGSVASDPGREAGRREETPIATWLSVAGKRLGPGGWLTAIQAMERLPDILGCLPPGLGSVEVLPLAARPMIPPKRFLLRARKGARAPFRLHQPFVLHQGPDHASDGGRYTPRAEAVLRDAAALPWPT